MVEAPDTALAHLRVLELGGLSAVSYAAHFLAELGADVVKVEPPGGDPARQDPPFAGDVADPDRGLAFLHYNINKRSVVLDLETPEGRQALLSLARTADVVVEGYRVGYLEGLGVGYPQLRQANPSLVLVSLTPFGQTGPLRGYKGNNAIAEAMCGMIWPLGDDARAPCVSPNQVLSQIAAIHGAYSALAAVHHRRHGGSGQHVDISLQDIGTNVQTGLAEYGLNRNMRRRPGARPGGGVMSIYPTQDGYIHIQPDQPHMWRALAGWMQDPVLMGPEWEERAYREQNQDVIQMILRPFIHEQTTDDFMREAQSRGLPSSPINTVGALVNSAQVAALGSFVERTHPVIGTYRGIGYPFRMTGSPMAFRRPAPRLGEHQAEVLAEARRAGRRAAPVAGGDNGRRRPLEGLRVLDFTRVIAGPAGTQLLGFLGADIIKVESADLPGAARQPVAGFPDLNRAKRSITLDVRTPEGRELAFRIAAHSDVVIDNFSAGVMGRLGLGYEEFRRVKPDIITISMPGFGRTGPLKDWVAFGQVLQAYDGLTWLWRHRETPIEAGIKGPVADYISCALVPLAVLAAVEHRDRTGSGQFIDLNMLEGVAHTMGPFYLEHILNGREPEPQGYRSARYAPFGAYPCRGDDAWCVIACETEEEWRAFGKAAGEPGWAGEERFATRAGRIQHREELDRLVAGWTEQYTARQVMHFLQREGVPAGMVQSCEDVFYDYHLRARGHIALVNHPAPWGPFEHQGLPAIFSETPGDATIPAPTMGQHNEEVFRGLLGLSQEEVRRLQEAKVIY